MGQAFDSASINRRSVMALGGLSLAALLADPRAARAAAEGLETVSLTLADGRTVSAALARPASLPAPAVMVIHEWWGLNDQIKAFSAALAREGFLVLAIDLMNGAVTGDPEAARRQIDAVKPEEARATVAGWHGFLTRHDAATGKIGTLGFCFGGAWSLNASLAAPVDATVVYYGSVAQTASALASLKGPVLAHFARQDAFIDAAMVTGFEAAMAEAGKTLTLHWYEADHGFANPTSARYDGADADLAYRRSLEFLRTSLR